MADNKREHERIIIEMPTRMWIDEPLGGRSIAFEGFATTRDLSIGGTFLHSSRTNPSKVKPANLPEFLKGDGGDGTTPVDCTAHVLKNLESLGVDTLIPIGGDDTLSFGERLHREGFPVVAIPKTLSKFQPAGRLVAMACDVSSS